MSHITLDVPGLGGRLIASYGGELAAFINNAVNGGSNWGGGMEAILGVGACL